MGAFSNLGEFSDAQAITAAAASTNIIDMATTRQQVGVGVPIYLCVRTNTAPTDAGDSLSIELQNDSVSNFASPRVWMVLCGAAGAELTVTDARLATAGAWIYRGVLPYECSERYTRLYYNNTTSNGTLTLDAWLSVQPPQSDIGQNAQIWVSPVGNP